MFFGSSFPHYIETPKISLGFISMGLTDSLSAKKNPFANIIFIIDSCHVIIVLIKIRF